MTSCNWTRATLPPGESEIPLERQWVSGYADMHRRLADIITRPVPAPMYAKAVARAFEEVHKQMLADETLSMRDAFAAYPRDGSGVVHSKFEECVREYERTVGGVEFEQPEWFPAGIDPHVIAAYFSTRYCVDQNGIELIIDAMCPAADALLRSTQARAAVFITAWNPHSKQQSRAQNDAANEKLRAELEALGLHPITGRGIGEDPNWEPEESFFVPGIYRTVAVDLGIKYQQNAIVWHEVGQATDLLYTVT